MFKLYGGCLALNWLKFYHMVDPLEINEIIFSKFDTSYLRTKE